MSATPIGIATSIVIAAPPERVWAVLADYAAYGDWNPYLVAVTGTASAGTDIDVTSVPVPGGPPMTQTVRVVAVDPPRLMRWEGGLPDRDQFRGDHRWHLTGEATGTRLDHAEVFTGSLADAILARHGDTIRAAFKRFNIALKLRAEP